MKVYLEDLLENESDPVRGRNLVREYLQARILECLQRAGAMIPLAFHGGTALRFLYAIPRYSEDLNFALERQGADYDFKQYLHVVRSTLANEGYEINIHLNDKKAVNAAFIKFYHLLYDLGLSSQSNEILSVKIEVDTSPPVGARLETTLIRRHVTLRLQHHDRASLLAGKLHAFLQCRFIKGRDLYDLLWYLSDPGWPEPNLTLLCNALKQTGWSGPVLDEANWQSILYQKLENVDWKKSIADVQPFLEKSSEITLLTRDNFQKLLD